MSNRGFLEDSATRHQIYVERFAGGSLKALAVFLLRALTMAKSRVAEGLSAYGTARYERQIGKLQQDLMGVYSEMGEESLGQLRDFGVYEATYNATLLGKAVKAVVQLNTPSPQIVSAAALAQPMRLETGKRHAKLNIAGALDQYGVKKSAEIVGEIRLGSALGETSNQISARLNSMGVLQRSQAEALTRTMTNHVATSARTQTLQENADILDGMRIIATLDRRTSLLCVTLDQDVIALTDPGPPFHWNACAKGTMVSTAGGQVAIEDVRVGDFVLAHSGRHRPVTAVMAKIDDGAYRKISTADGLTTTLTIDHPVLCADRGWMAAGDLEVGDLVIGAYFASGKAPAEVWQFMDQSEVSSAHAIQTETVERLTAYSFSSFIPGDSCSSRGRGFGVVDTASAAPFIAWFSSEVTSIDEMAGAQWVYNLSVHEDETYVADSILVHNCRTTVVPVLKAEYARDIPGSTRPSKGADGVAPVNSKTSYPEWLARQPASFQKDVLGRTRYELFSKGKLDIDKFIDNGRTLTLDQLREREPESFERSGLN